MVENTREDLKELNIRKTTKEINPSNTENQYGTVIYERR